MNEILLPALSPTMEEAILAKWLVAPGDKVRPGDVLAEIETDKATMELEAEREGVIGQILVRDGTEGVLVDTVIALFADEAASVAAPIAPEPTGAPAQPPQSSAPPKSEAPQPAPQPTPQAQPGSVNTTATPLARRIAALAGLDLARVTASGPHGKVLRRDVEAALGGPVQRTPVLAPQPRVPDIRIEPAGRPALAPPPGAEVIALDGMRRTIARRMTESFRDIPHFPLTLDVCADRLLEVRADLNERLKATGEKISLNDMLIKAAARALAEVPEVNVSYSSEGLVRHPHADIAVAVAIDGGLITPILKAAETKTIRAIASEIRSLAQRAREKKLRPDEFNGGTFSISNLGMYGVQSFSSIINEPQAAILSIGAAEPRPVVRSGQLAVATMVTVTLTCDHRAMDGAIGARWLSVFRDHVQEPLLLI